MVSLIIYSLLLIIGLYPLNEQGEYGQPPRALPPPPPFKRRELKPKV